MSVRIVFFGDSICCGVGVSVHLGWVSRISRTFQDKYGSQVEITNASVSGDTTRTALIRMGYHVMNHNFDIMIVQFGMNDCNRWATEKCCNRVSLGSFKGNLNEIIHRGFTSGIQRIFLMTTHPSNRPTYGLELEEYNRVIRKVAGSYESVDLIDIESELKNQSGYLSEDRIHLTEKGNQLYYDIATPCITKAVGGLLCK